MIVSPPSAHIGEGREMRIDNIVAISLTLCSLASAMQNVPSDCEAWYRATYLGEQDATPVWKIWKSTSDARSPSARQTCLG